MQFLWICLGGALGTGARYLLSIWALQSLGPGFPWGTWMVNTIGSFLISLVMHLGLSTQLFSPALRLFLTTGLMGGFTTYSTFNFETLQYFSEGAWAMGLMNISLTFLSCLIAGIGGVLTAKWLIASPF